MVEKILVRFLQKCLKRFDIVFVYFFACEIEVKQEILAYENFFF